MIARLVRNTAFICIGFAVIGGLWSRDVRVVGGVLAGGVLIGLALWALAGVVTAVVGPAARVGVDAHRDAAGTLPSSDRVGGISEGIRGETLTRHDGRDDACGGRADGGVVRAETAENVRVSRAFPLVKFFTRHVILALVAYVMMVRLHLDPVGMVVGVTSVVVAAIVEAARPR